MISYYAIHLAALLAAVVTGYPPGWYFRESHARR